MTDQRQPGPPATKAREAVVWERMPSAKARTRLLVGLLAKSDRLYGLAKWLSQVARRIDTGLVARADFVRGLPADAHRRGLLPEATQYWAAQDASAVRERIEGLSTYLQVAAPLGVSFIRVGGEADGGYVMLSDFARSDFFLSLGVGPDVSWDQQVAPIGSGIHLYDHTVERLPGSVDAAVFYRERISGQVGPGRATLRECIARTPGDLDLILKMDIEGSEWEVLATAEASDLLRCRQIAVEYHDLIWAAIDPDKYSAVSLALERIFQTHQPVYLHANNYGNFQVLANVPVPDVIEVTYVRRGNYRFPAPLPVAAEGLQRPNDRTFPEITMGFPVSVRSRLPSRGDGGRDDAG